MWPDRAQYRPGETVTLCDVPGQRVLICELGHPVTWLPVEGGQARWTAPEGLARSARGFRAAAVDEAGQVVDATAFDVARHWSLAPRYGFLSDFKPVDTADAVAGMARLHLNVVQYYDWMYTHYQYFAETEEFTDPLGRLTSHRVVRERIEACHRHGMAALAYGSLYGGEKPIALEHPEWLLYDGNGQPFHLIDLFYIQNIERGCGWREWIIHQYEEACRQLGFDGIHIDQYGFPKRALYRPAPGEERVVDMTAAFPDFVAEACQRLRAVKPEGGSIFNCVNNWPVEQIAPLTGDAATYIEVWSPHDTYRDLHDLVRNARALGPHKQVILSAYLGPFHRKDERPEGALSGLKLATAAINAAGGYHLLLGEGNGVLADAYYPMYGRLSPADLAVVQGYYDFLVANEALLHDLDLRDVSNTWSGGFDAETRETNFAGPVKFSPRAEPGKVWVIAREKPGLRVLHLINLTGLEHDRWNSAQPQPEPVQGIELVLARFSPVKAVWCASPDNGGEPRQLAFEPTADGRPFMRIGVPELHLWSMVWVEE